MAQRLNAYFPCVSPSKSDDLRRQCEKYNGKVTTPTDNPGGLCFHQVQRDDDIALDFCTSASECEEDGTSCVRWSDFIPPPTQLQQFECSEEVYMNLARGDKRAYGEACFFNGSCLSQNCQFAYNVPGAYAIKGYACGPRIG
jgi:hypothetical protein